MGEAFFKSYRLPDGIPELKFSNFLEDTLDQLALDGFEEVLLVSHIGKLSKVAGGIMNTHSRTADCRAEILCAHAASALKAEYTLPDVTQTVIITRMEGCTPVPEREKMRLLASHGSTMVVFLSTEYERSKLYDPTFETGYRKASSHAQDA